MTKSPCWRKSTYSANTSTCVELHHTLAAVRDSKQPAGAELSVPGLPEFIRRLRAGHFDR